MLFIPSDQNRLKDDIIKAMSSLKHWYRAEETEKAEKTEKAENQQILLSLLSDSILCYRLFLLGSNMILVCGAFGVFMMSQRQVRHVVVLNHYISSFKSWRDWCSSIIWFLSFKTTWRDRLAHMLTFGIVTSNELRYQRWRHWGSSDEPCCISPCKVMVASIRMLIQLGKYLQSTSSRMEGIR